MRIIISVSFALCAYASRSILPATRYDARYPRSFDDVRHIDTSERTSFRSSSTLGTEGDIELPPGPREYPVSGRNMYRPVSSNDLIGDPHMGSPGAALASGNSASTGQRDESDGGHEITGNSSEVPITIPRQSIWRRMRGRNAGIAPEPAIPNLPPVTQADDTASESDRSDNDSIASIPSILDSDG